MKGNKRKKPAKRGKDAKKILLFGFDGLPAILAVEAAAQPFGAEVVAAPRESWGQTLASFAERGPVPGGEGTAGGRMMVFCGLEEELDALLPALSAAGAGTGCLKAVLTARNRSWTASSLYQELLRERRTLEGV